MSVLDERRAKAKAERERAARAASSAASSAAGPPCGRESWSSGASVRSTITDRPTEAVRAVGGYITGACECDDCRWRRFEREGCTP